MRRVSVSFLLLLLAGLALGQGGFGQSSIRWSGFKSGDHSNIRTARTLVINNEAEFQRYWLEHTGERTAPSSDIRWGQEMLVAIHLGERRSGGFSVRVERVERVRPNEVRVSYVERTPSGVATTVIISPWEIIRMERVPGQITFAQRVEQDRNIGGWRDVPPPPVMTWRTYQSELTSRITEPRNFIIRSELELEEYWRRAIGEPAPLGEIDWNQEMLVAIHLGSRRSSGFDVLVESVEPTMRGLVVRYIEKTPAPGQRTRPVMLAPYAIIRIPRAAMDVRFERRVWDSSG
jgi:hypothetical protein